MRISRFFIILVFSLVFTFGLNGQTERKYIRQGNKDYSQAQYSEAELLYRKAIETEKTSSNAVFNLGDALYKQEKYDEAALKFSENFSSTADKKKMANSMFNLGNSLLKSQKVEESIEAYKNSLKLDPSSTEAKYNLAYAQDLLKQQQQEQQQNQDQNKDQQDNKKDENKDPQNNDQQNQDDQKPGDQQEQQQQQGISKEDAERLLSAIANDEVSVQEKVAKDKAEKGMIRTLKNW